MKSTDDSSSKPLSLVFCIWVLLLPLLFAGLAVAGFILMCWLGDGTLASLYRVEYFMPLPLYCFVVFVVVFPSMVILGFVVTVGSFLNRRICKERL